MRFLWLAIAALLTASTLRAETLAPGLHDIAFRNSRDNTEQRALLFVPRVHQRGEVRPLIVALHGLGGDRFRFFNDTRLQAWAEREGWIVLSPDARGDWFYRGPGEDDLLQSIDEAKRLTHVDENRVILMGHSMGGWGTWQTACAHPDLFAGIIPMAGWAPLEMIPNIAHIPTLVIHGGADRVIPMDNSRDAVRALRAAGGEVRHWEAPQQGHDPKLIDTLLPLIATWVRDQRRGEPADAIQIRTRLADRGNHGGATIVETTRSPDLAGLDVENQDHAVNVETFNVSQFTLDRRWLEGEVIVDGQPCPLPTLPSSAAMLFRLQDEDWAAHAVRSEQATPTPSPVITQHEWDMHPTIVRLGSALAKATSAEACLMTPLWNTPQPPTGPLTTEMLFDMNPRPMQVQWIGTARSGTLQRLIQSGSIWMVPMLNLDNPKEIYTITFAAVGEPTLPSGMWATSTGQRTVDLLHAQVSDTGELP